MKYPGEIFDVHLHMCQGFNITLDKHFQIQKDIINKTGMDRISLLSMTSWGDPDCYGQNVLTILFKAINPSRVHCFGGLDHNLSRNDYVGQARQLHEMGFDGVKMLEGKPTSRRIHKLPLNSPKLDGYYRFLEEKDLPVLLHLADPREFWDEDACPPRAKDAGWFYGDPAFPGYGELYDELEDILGNYSGIRFCLAHFLFMSDDHDRLCGWLDRFSNLSIDITPGVEMYANFSTDTELWRKFFTRYDDRILFGTDNGFECGIMDPGYDKVGYAVESASIIRRFLETDDEFTGMNSRLRGLNLERDSLEKLYRKNASTFCGISRDVNIEEVEKYAVELISLIKNKDFTNKKAVLNQLEEAVDIIREL